MADLVELPSLSAIASLGSSSWGIWGSIGLLVAWGSSLWLRGSFSFGSNLLVQRVESWKIGHFLMLYLCVDFFNMFGQFLNGFFLLFISIFNCYNFLTDFTVIWICPLFFPLEVHSSQWDSSPLRERVSYGPASLAFYCCLPSDV